MTMMCNVGSTIANKCTTLVEDVDNGEVYECVGQAIYEKFLYFPLNFALNLKLLQEKNILNKTKRPLIIHSSVGQKSEYGMIMTVRVYNGTVKVLRRLFYLSRFVGGESASRFKQDVLQKSVLCSCLTEILFFLLDTDQRLFSFCRGCPHSLTYGLLHFKSKQRCRES